MGERLRRLVDRYRAHRIRYVAIVAGSVSVLLAAGVTYIYLDADKRTSERALATLQFCHLALRTADEKRALDEQRHNLTSIHDTAGEIRQLIDKLPPAEQAKASEIINHMDEAVGRERRVISEHLQRSEDTTLALTNRAQSIERSLGGLETDLGTLKTLPADVRALGTAIAKEESRAALASDKLAAANDRLAEANAALAMLQRTVSAVADRPAPVCPACVCNERPAGPSTPQPPAAVARKSDEPVQQ
jgi:chromosome segregation ATPase